LVDIAIDQNVELWGVGGLTSTRRASEAIGLSLVWHARQDISENFSLQFALTDPTGKPVESWQREPIAFYPTPEWRRGEILKASYDLLLPRTLAPGEYALSISVGKTPIVIGKVQITP